MRNAYAAWVAATRFMFWSFVEAITSAVDLRKNAQRELTAFNPRKPKDIFASGYAVFLWEPYWDDWKGYWSPPDRPPHVVATPDFQVTSWNGIPWHRVKFTEYSGDGREFRAVPLEYARKNLAYGSLMAAA